MDKEEALNDFLRGLRIVFNNATAYPKDHPYFIKSVENFKQKVNTLFNFLNPIKINIAPDSLFIGDRHWDKAEPYVELASLLHLRKIKSIEFREGLTIEELIDFLSSISLPLKEILREAGVQNILNRKNISRIHTEELDYSELLRGEGEEIKDVWVYLFKSVLEKGDQLKINEFADNFEKIVGKLKAKDLLEDEQLRQNIHNFFNYLKEKQKDRFYNCSKGLLRLILKDKTISQEDKLQNLKVFFNELDKSALTEILRDEILTDDSFNYLSFIVFSKLIEEDKHKEIASSLKEGFKKEELLKNNPKIRKRIRELFSISDRSSAFEIYRHALYSLLDESSSGGTFPFEYDVLHINYRFALLNLLAGEENAEKLSLISEHLLKECANLTEENLDYLKFLWKTLNKKIKGDVSPSELFERLKDCICGFIENRAFKETPSLDLEYFIDKLKNSVLGYDFYINKIFNEGKVNTCILKLFFNFFPQYLLLFYENLKRKHTDIEFLAKVAESLGGIDSLAGLEILKNIYSLFNNIIKMEVLRAMQKLSMRDDDFLFGILEEGDFFLKRQAFVILAGDELTRRTALQRLLAIPSLFGRENKLLIENIKVVEDIGLKEAGSYLSSLGRRHFFWNKNVRDRAKSALRKLAC